jgi:hypothetical protein
LSFNQIPVSDRMLAEALALAYADAESKLKDNYILG